MTIFLTEPRETGTIRSRPRAAPHGLGEEIAAGWEAGRRVVNLNKTDVLEREETERRIDAIEQAIGERLPNPYTERYDEVDENDVLTEYRRAGMRGYEARQAIVGRRRAAFEDRVRELRNKFPDAAIDGRDEAKASIQRRAQDLEVQLGEAGLGGFVGAAGAGFTDPFNIATAPVGGSSKTVLGAAIKTAGVNVGLEVLATPLDQAQRRELGLETGLDQAALNIAMAGLFGFGLGGAFKGGERALGRLSRREAVEAADALPDHVKTPDVVAARNALEKEIITDDAVDVVSRPDPQIAADHAATLARVEDAAEAGRPIAAAAEAPGVARETSAPPAAGGFALFDPDDLLVDAKRFQFKSGGDAQGVTDALKGVLKWDPIKAGTTLVWESVDGRFFVADGHQRTGLARRLKARGQKVEIRADLLREADGFTAEDVRAIAAAKNIAQGTGTAADAAKVLKVRPELLDGTINQRSSLVRTAQGLTRLGDDAFSMVINEVVPDHFGAIVGRLVDNPAEQVAVLGVLARQSPANAVEAEALVRQASSAGFTREVQQGLFGDIETAESMLAHRAAVLSRAVSLLRRDKRIFATLTEEADTIEAAGNRLAAATNEELARNAAEISEIVLRTAHLAGPVADALRRAAAHVAAGGQRAKAVRQFIDELRELGPAALRGLDTRGSSPGGAGRALEAESAGGRSSPAATSLDDFDAAAQADELTAELFGDQPAREGSSDGTPSRSRNDGDAGGADINSARSTPGAGDQAAPSHSSISRPFGEILTAEPSSRLGARSQSGRLVMHASDDVDAIYASLSAAKDSIDKDLQSLVNDIPGAAYQHSRLKERGARLDQKLTRRSASEIGDLLGARIIADDAAAMDAVLDGIAAAGGRIIEIDDFIDAAKGTGYRAMHLQIAAGDVSFELQIQPKAIHEVQKQAHKIYQRWRGRTLEDLTPDELAQRAADQKQAKELFDDAWKTWRDNPRNLDRPARAPLQDPVRDPGEAFLIGETLDEDGGIGPRMQTREELEAEFKADDDMLERLKGCVR